jgi:hypothetical protein
VAIAVQRIEPDHLRHHHRQREHGKLRADQQLSDWWRGSCGERKLHSERDLHADSQEPADIGAEDHGQRPEQSTERCPVTIRATP